MEVAFPSAVDEAADLAAAFEILGPNNSRLAVQAAQRLPDENRVLLTTSAQDSVAYRLLVTNGEPSSLCEASIQGSTIAEPRLATATALTNTTVLLIFDVPVDALAAQDATAYQIVEPDLTVTSAPSAERRPETPSS